MQEKLPEQEQGYIHISFSELSKYLECPHRHLIEKYLALEQQPPSIHLYFGTAMHEAIEATFKQQIILEKRIEYFKEKFFNDMNKNLSKSPEMKYVKDFLDQGENLLKILPIEKIFETYILIGVEIPLYEHLFDKYFFKGFIDIALERIKNKKKLIADWKTSGEAWDIEKKISDDIFTSQMGLYKHFYSKKNNIPFENIECKYFVLNRLKDKKNTEGGFGEIQKVPVIFNENKTNNILNTMIETLNNIHVKKEFPKAKYNGKLRSCTFCPFKKNHPLCNSNQTQCVELLEKYGKNRKQN